jgi:surface antigen
MPLTIETATQAGQLATAITALTALTSTVQAAIDGGVVVTQIDVRLKHPDGSGDTLHGELEFTAAESASIFNDVISIYQARLTDLNSQLAALVP